jgi:hypothetical protein
MLAKRDQLGTLAAAVVVLVTGCSGGGKRSSPTTTRATRAESAKVVRIDILSKPEGPAYHYDRTRNAKAFADIVASLPSNLPPSSGTQSCEVGATLVFTLVDGTARRYGPCGTPASIRTAMQAFH